MAFVLDVSVAWFLARPSRLGMEGAAIAQALTLTFSSTARLFLVHRFVGIWPFDRDFVRLVPAAAAGGVVMLLVHVALPEAKWLVNLGGSAVLGGLAYGAVLVAVGLRPGERRALLSMGGRLLGRGSR
jgi:hypothetical protein